MMPKKKNLLLLSVLLVLVHPLWAEDAEDTEKKTIKFRSPDGHFAFRYDKGEAGQQTDEKPEEVFNLIDARSGKVLMEVAKSDYDLGPSARFNMEVLWKPDAKAFALTGTFTKRGSDVTVFLWNGAGFRAVDLPKLEAEITEKAKRGKNFAKTTEINSQTANRWQKDGSLVVEVETREDGEDGSITATRTVVLGFDKSDKARVLKSSIKFAIEKD
jgi:hypothetical protein